MKFSNITSQATFNIYETYFILALLKNYYLKKIFIKIKNIKKKTVYKLIELL